MASAGGLYEKVLERLGSGESPVPPARIRDSAAVVLWRRDADGRLQVFWVERAGELSFMGGWHAFPGGGLSRRDREMPLAGRPQGIDDGPSDAGIPALVREGVGRLGPVLPPGLAGCALRELLEETGVVPLSGAAGDRGGEELSRRLATARRELLERSLEPARLAERLGVELDASRLVYAGRWLTPPLGPIRFDNRFFLLEWPVSLAVQPAVEPGELASGGWIAPQEALDRWRQAEVITAPPILHILAVLAEEGPDAGLGRLRNPVETNLGDFRRVEFRPGVILFPLATPTLPPAGYTNAYLLGLGEAALIDPGSPFEREIDALAEALEAAALQGRRTREIWLTHHHPDHVGGVEALRRRLDLPVFAHRRAARRLAARGVRVDGELRDGERRTLAGDAAFPVRVLHTPGHARGHLAFYDETGGSLIAGDVVAGLGTIVIDPPDGEMESYLQTLERLRRLAPRTLFPAHGPPILDAVGKLEEYLEHRLWREGRVLASWRAGRRDPTEMVAEVYGDELDTAAVPLAERQIVAHLERLRALGRL